MSKSRTTSPSPKPSSREPSRERARSVEESVTIHLESEEVAFVLGRGGHTKHKLARVSRTRIEVSSGGDVTIYGSPAAQEKAQHYIQLVLAQRTGPVYLDDVERDDLTVLKVPKECAGYITGRGGNSLRSIEEDSGTLMFFALRRGEEQDETERDDKLAHNTEQLAIFGTNAARCHATLKVMSSVEYKIPGHYIEDKTSLKEPITQFDEPDFVIESQPIPENEYSYCVGRMGSTRKKLAYAAECVLEYIGYVAFFAGRPENVACCRNYLQWLQEQRVGAVDVDTEGRTDVSVVTVKASYIGWITGSRGTELRRVEERSHTFIFTDGDRNDRDNTDREERVLVFSTNEECRRRAVHIIEDRIEQKKKNDEYRSTHRDRSPRRHRSPPRGGYGRYDRGGHGRGGYDRGYDRRDNYRRDNYRRDDYRRDDYRRNEPRRDEPRRDEPRRSRERSLR